MQNDAKMHHKSARNDHEKTQIPILQCSKTHAVDRAAKLHENAFILVVPVLRCSKNEFQNHPKSSRIYPKCPPRGGPIRSVYDMIWILEFRRHKPRSRRLQTSFLAAAPSAVASSPGLVPFRSRSAKSRAPSCTPPGPAASSRGTTSARPTIRLLGR